jgi:peptidase YpeB-like protein
VFSVAELAQKGLPASGFNTEKGGPMRTRGLGLILIAGMLAGSSAAAADTKSQQKIAMVREAKVRLSDAVAKATAKVAGDPVEVEIARKKKLVWEIEVLTPEGKLVEVDVAADTGEVVDTEAQK